VLLVEARLALDLAADAVGRFGAPARGDAFRSALVARLHDEREWREVGLVAGIGGAEDAVLRGGDLGGAGEVFGPRLVEREREGEGVGAEAGDAGELEEDGRVGLAVAAAVALGDVDGGVEPERALPDPREERPRRADADGLVAERADGGSQRGDGFLGLE